MIKPKYNLKTLEISKEIASNCTKCKKCMKECVMMNDFGESPQDIFTTFLENKHIDPIIPYSCNLCNKCTIVCPKKLKISKAFMSIRESIVEGNKGKSPLNGHFAVYIHQLLNFKLRNIFTTRRR